MKPIWILSTVIALSACANGPTRRSYNDGASPSSTPASRTDNKTSASQATRNEAIRRAQAFYSKGDYKSALATLSYIPEGQVKGAELTEYWNLRGLVELANKTPAAAEASFQKALQANTHPEYAGYYQYNLATAYADAGKKEDALRAIGTIDLSKMELADQRKVDVLREKLLLPGPPPSSGHGSEPAISSPMSPGAPIAQTTEIYQGPVNPNRVGLLLPMSGKYEAFGKKVQRAIELAFQHSDNNRTKDIELVPMDSGDSPFTQQNALKKLVEEQQVVAVIGPLLSKGIETLATQAEHYQIPLVSIAQVQGIATPHLFSCSISTQDQAAKMADYAMKVRGFRRFAILAPSNKVGEETAHNFWDEVLSRGGEVRAFELYDPDLTDFREPVDKALGLHYTEVRTKELKELAEKRAELKITKKTMKTQQYFSLPPIIDFDAVFIADEAKTVGQIIPTFAYRDARGLSYLGVTSWNSPQLVTRAQEQAEGATFPVVFNTLAPPQTTKRFYDLYSSTYSTNPGELDALAYDTANLVIKVMNDRPSTREEFKEKLEKTEDVEGATGRVSVKEHRCVRDLALYTVKKGVFEVLPNAEK